MSEIQLSNFQSSRRHSLRGATTGRTLESGVGAPSTGHADAEAGVLSRLAGRWLLCASFQGSTGSARARGWESHVGDTGILRKSLPECKIVQRQKDLPKTRKPKSPLHLRLASRPSPGARPCAERVRGCRGRHFPACLGDWTPLRRAKGDNEALPSIRGHVRHACLTYGLECCPGRDRGTDL
jgi:hypothetical protein